MTTKYLRFADLRDRGIVGNRATLRNWITKRGFPPGVLLGPNSRSWNAAEVETWIAARPVEPKATTLPPRRKRSPQTAAA